MATETELKLRLDRTGPAKLRRHPLIRRLKAGKAVIKDQKSVYFDTPGLALWKNRVALRVRHEGERRIQTVKTPGQSLSGVWARGEWESDIAGDRPVLARIGADCPAEILRQPGLAETLAPLFVTEVRRTQVILRDVEGEVELALDEGRIVAGERVEEICEVELELRSGTPALLFRLAIELQADIGLHLGSASKADRGYALASGEAPTPTRASPILLPATASAAQAFQAVARAALGQIVANQDCFLLTSDPEAVHQMRVGLRRLRSAMALFKSMLGDADSAAIKSELRWLSGHLGPPRDLDVFIAEIIEPLAPALGADEGFAALNGRLAAERDASYGVARQIMALPRHARLILSLGQWIEAGAWLKAGGPGEKPAREAAREILAKRHKAVERHLAGLRHLPPDQRHEGRIRVKTLRYAVDFFQSLFPAAKMARQAALLGTLQDTLGLLNDIAVAWPRLRELAGASPAEAWAAGVIAGWHTSREAVLLEQATETRRRLKRARRPWDAG